MGAVRRRGPPGCGAFRENPLGLAALAWSFFPLSAGIFNVCWISLALGGPFSSATIRQLQRRSP